MQVSQLTKGAINAQDVLMRLPTFLSIHMRPPPAPQHMDFSRDSAISSGESQHNWRSTSRGASNSP